jgi:hypothetical protein
MANHTKQVPEVEIAKFVTFNLRKQVGETEKDTALLTWSTRKGFPRITVWAAPSVMTEDGKIDYSKVITAPFDYITLGILLDKLEECIKSDKEMKHTIDCLNIKFSNGARTDEIYTQAKVIVGRDPNGVIYISAIEENKPKIKFELVPTTWFKFYKPNSNEEIRERRELSASYSKSYLENLRAVFKARLVAETVTVVKLGSGETTMSQAAIPPKVTESAKPTQQAEQATTKPEVSSEGIIFNEDGIDF